MHLIHKTSYIYVWSMMQSKHTARACLTEDSMDRSALLNGLAFTGAHLLIPQTSVKGPLLTTAPASGHLDTTNQYVWWSSCYVLGRLCSMMIEISETLEFDSNILYVMSRLLTFPRKPLLATYARLQPSQLCYKAQSISCGCGVIPYTLYIVSCMIFVGKRRLARPMGRPLMSLM